LKRQFVSEDMNRVDSQLQPELGYMHPPPPFLKYATKVKLSTGAGLLVRDGTRHPLKMVIEIDGIGGGEGAYNQVRVVVVNPRD
jgi:hypothetical protein